MFVGIWLDVDLQNGGHILQQCTTNRFRRDLGAKVVPKRLPDTIVDRILEEFESLLDVFGGILQASG